MSNHKHTWKEVGQTYTNNTRTLVYWCESCGALKFKRTAGDYKTSFKRTSFAVRMIRKAVKINEHKERCGF